ncbi:MAG: DNA polymerase III subunit gamma/tau [Burkholderiales bacterium]|nr:DNA polymerase III subunit gamma/tau [Burkholderiales bacterium]
MSYQVLARKWRPRNFASLVGQEHVVRALTHALAERRLHHAYLFTGTRGVGKTTLARILAKALNCETGVTPEPCGVCTACVEIDSGRFVDLLEVDAATNTKVDEMRVLLENAVYAPTRGRFKVYVIDEVHMLSTSAFNAMLKTLEEPPEHIKFILATTDPQKIPVTVLSRCLQFNLKQMPPGAIAGHLERIAGEENVRAEAPALRLLAQAARGSMRDALSLLDQAIAFSAGDVSEAAVRGMLGTVDRGHLVDILAAIARGDGPAAIAAADAMESRSLSFDSALQELGTLLHRIALVQVAPAAVAPDEPDAGRIGELAAAIDPETVQLYYQIAVHGRADLPLAPDEYAGFTMALMRMLAFAPGPDAKQPTVLPGSARAAAPGGAGTARGQAPSPAAPARAPMAGAPAFDGDWPALVRSLRLTGLAKQLAERCELAAHAAGRFELKLPATSRHLAERAYVDKLKAALAERLGAAVAVTVVLGEVTGATVAALEESARRSRIEEAEATVHADAFVRDLVENFDATIDSIKPVR